MERETFLRQKQKDIFDDFLTSLEKAKNMGIHLRYFMVNPGLSAPTSGTTVLKDKFPEWVKDQTFESWQEELTNFLI